MTLEEEINFLEEIQEYPIASSSPQIPKRTIHGPHYFKWVVPEGGSMLRGYSWLKIIVILSVIMIFGIAIWRGFPPFNIRTSDYPGLLQTTEVRPQQIEVKIYKSERKLVLYGDGKPIGIFKTALGFDPVGNKKREGDGKTPEGRFVICFINTNTPYLYYYGLSYPNIKDAERGLKHGVISQKEYQQIVDASQSGSIPFWNTALGGEVGIHGAGNWMDWTKGCVAVSDADILSLKGYLNIGTSVEIFP